MRPRSTVLALAALAGCLAAPAHAADPPSLILATTTSTQDSGLLDVLVPMFEKETGIVVKVIAVGTGEALAMGRRGDADVLLVHSRKAEDAFMAEGLGSLRHDVMYNDFVLVGPPADPAGVKGMEVVEAMRKIAAAPALWVSRGDNSGTHKKEQELWKLAGVTPPSGGWLISTGQGMGETARIASEKQGYTLIDRGTYLAQRASLALVILSERSKDLFNPYGVIVVKPEKLPKVHAAEAKRFADWLVSPAVQKVIGEFGREKYGQSLFIPDAH